MKQVTAVEWLYERLERMIPRSALYDIDKREYFEQAKEMEEEQIVQAFNLGQQEEAKQPFWTKGAKYYEETFNK